MLTKTQSTPSIPAFLIQRYELQLFRRSEAFGLVITHTFHGMSNHEVEALQGICDRQGIHYTVKKE